MEKRHRIQFINSLTGFKSVCLVGTSSAQGVHNLAVFSQVFHLGANPALLGMIIRPASVPRHTWSNIQATKSFTLNHLHESFVEKAHQCSAKYPEEVSEFEEVGLTPESSKIVSAPYVKESRVKIGLVYQDHKLIELNETIMVIGEIAEVKLEGEYQQQDGFVDLEQAGTLTVSGLDAYHKTSKVGRYTYAKPNTPLSKLPS